MLRLPAHPHHSTLRAFGLAVPCTGGILVALVAVAAGLPKIAAGAGAAAAVAGAIALAQPRWFRSAYDAWNRAAGFYGRALAWLVKAVCFHLVIRAVGSIGGALKLREPSSARSAWTARGPEPGRPNIVSFPAAGWMGHSVSWALKSGNAWTIVLVPFLSLLAWLEPDAAREVPSNVYTLY